MPVLLQIALGGALGAMLRYGAVLASVRVLGPSFPWGTVLVNVAGSFLMGLLFVLLLSRGDIAAQRYAPLLMPGVLGGFTTFSAFSLDTYLLIERGRTLAAAGYAGGTVALSLLGFVLGVWAARGTAS